MLFNSFDFAIFLPVVFLLYWFVFKHSLRLQNALIVVASYVFYGWWDWRFLSLILFSTLVDFLVGKQLGKEAKDNKRRLWLWLSVVVNLGFLGFFKYFNFFLENFQAAFSFFGFEIGGRALSIVLPVGISFYTFQTMSYTIDVYRRRMEPTKDFIAFAAFVSFFPQLVAGPIERATHLLPQFYRSRKFNYALAVNGCRQILWGFFKKLVIADNCAEFANQIFNNSEAYGGSTLFLGALFFTFQIYGDFSGYSDIAIGTSRLFGFDLMKNFAFPYFSRDIAEFWRRWHISLSTWFRDYVYIPLGGSRGNRWKQIRNVFIIFIVSGFWHGANWTFILWGALNALYFLPLLLLNLNRYNLEVVAQKSVLPSLKELAQIGITFVLTVLAWVAFRAETISHAGQIYAAIFNLSFFSIPAFDSLKGEMVVLIMISFMIGMEWIYRKRNFALDNIHEQLIGAFRWAVYCLIFLLIVFFRQMEGNIEFIYFQF
ncbi:MBOAT family O-acyltransferase [uncultured Roseivirga sp.]|uniref:MBOAT family O-acyltransferase n=1 Tax=uncultured Roseivirga sp. TaxID=543088 RepID=UPI000D78E4F9|nr:MBOAT family O-acyltransferase [uncultured Roseivirga sp.]PWL32318.1 MAG: membrane-bound O-acyltransferase family protein [Roseivirga sp. XM-24bin3]